MPLIPRGTKFIPVICPGMFFPNPARAIGSHAVRFVPKAPGSRKAHQLVRPGSTSKHKCPSHLSIFLGINFVLLFARLQSTREEIRLVEVIHGVQCEVSLNRGSINIFASAGFFHSPGRYFESSKAE